MCIAFGCKRCTKCGWIFLSNHSALQHVSNDRTPILLLVRHTVPNVDRDFFRIIQHFDIYRMIERLPCFWFGTLYQIWIDVYLESFNTSRYIEWQNACVCFDLADPIRCGWIFTPNHSIARRSSHDTTSILHLLQQIRSLGDEFLVRDFQQYSVHRKVPSVNRILSCVLNHVWMDVSFESFITLFIGS